jgi:hypothetical protein
MALLCELFPLEHCGNGVLQAAARRSSRGDGTPQSSSRPVLLFAWAYKMRHRVCDRHACRRQQSTDPQAATL